jgi:methyl-accepting chemotaxis protein
MSTPPRRPASSEQKSSVASRLMLGIALIALAAFGLTAAISYWKSSRALLASSQATLENLAQFEAQRMAIEMSQTYDAVQTLAESLHTQRGQVSRATVDQTLKQQLALHPERAGMCVLFEPDAFDGKDAEFVNAPSHDATGRFMSYWARVGDELVSEPLRDYDDPELGAWYVTPKTLKKPVVIEPYPYEVGGKTLLLTTIAIPIMEGDEVLGVVTSDFELSRLQQRVSLLKPMGTGHAELLSPMGTVVGSPDAGQIGRKREDATTKAILAATAEDKLYTDFSADANGMVKVYAPLRVGENNRRFALGIYVPRDLLTAQARSLLGLVALVGLLAAASLCAGLWLLLRTMVLRPLADAVRVSGDVAQGRLDTTIPQRRNDELGQLLRAQSNMREQIRAVIQAQNEMATRHDEGSIGYRIDASGFAGDYGRMVQETNALVGSHVQVQQRLIEVMKHYAVGDLSVDMDRLPGEKAAITQAMDETKASLSAINAEIKRLASAAAAGDFSLRGDEDRFQHDFHAMVAGLNQLMETTDGNLAQVSSLLQAIARGDLSARMQGDFHGVFASMRDDANSTVAQLTSIIGRIQSAASSINLAASEIAQGNNDLSRRTEQQAANLEETAASMEELTSTVRQNAEHARQANQLAQGAHGVASQGGEIVGKVVTTMSAIEASSKKIADIISVIDGIAFQTNILALNAAVEAARAGEQGRGFAVVASEVRTLAQRSAGAAKEIKGLIEDSVGKVADGSQLVHQAGSTMGEIVSSVQRVTDIMAEISAASQEQSAGIEQVNQTVVQMDETTQQNAALVEEATAAARSMEEQAAQLAEAVALFRLATGPAAGDARKNTGKAKAAARPAPAPPRPAPVRSIESVTASDEGGWQEF